MQTNIRHTGRLDLIFQLLSFWLLLQESKADHPRNSGAQDFLQTPICKTLALLTLCSIRKEKNKIKINSTTHPSSCTSGGGTALTTVSSYKLTAKAGIQWKLLSIFLITALTSKRAAKPFPRCRSTKNCDCNLFSEGKLLTERRTSRHGTASTLRLAHFICSA